MAACTLAAVAAVGTTMTTKMTMTTAVAGRGIKAADTSRAAVTSSRRVVAGKAISNRSASKAAAGRGTSNRRAGVKGSIPRRNIMTARGIIVADSSRGSTANRLRLVINNMH